MRVAKEKHTIFRGLDYYPFGAEKPGRNFASGEYKYGYNGKEMDNEVSGDGNSYDYGFRIYNPRIAKFLSVDPLTSSYPSWSPYPFAMNSPISGVDLDGLEYYYAADGSLIGKLGTSTEVRIVTASNVDSATSHVSSANGSTDSKIIESLTTKANESSIKLGIDNDVLIAFAAVVDLESSGTKDESYAIANTTMNYVDGGGSVNDLKTLEDVILYDNSFAQGATQANYTSFIAKTAEKQNAKYALGAAINAVGFSKKLDGFSDFSGGATGWDGLDLICTKWTNTHRSYKWNEESKTLVEQYKKDNNGGVDVSKWTYTKTKYDISATKIVGKSLYQKLEGARGEKKQSTTKFK